jgi:anti-sigma factor RsiW
MLMTCARTQQLLQLYLDGRLTLSRARALERHLAACPLCRAELAALEEVVTAVQSLGHVTEPAWLGEAIMQRVASATAQPPRDLPAGVQENLGQMLGSPFSRLTRRDVFLAFALATLVMSGFILLSPALRSALLNDTNPMVAPLLQTLQTLFSLHGGVVILMGWGLGIALGIWITLVLAGNEIRTFWRQRQRERLPQNRW